MDARCDKSPSNRKMFMAARVQSGGRGGAGRRGAQGCASRRLVETLWRKGGSGNNAVFTVVAFLGLESRVSCCRRGQGEGCRSSAVERRGGAGTRTLRVKGSRRASWYSQVQRATL